MKKILILLLSLSFLGALQGQTADIIVKKKNQTKVDIDTLTGIRNKTILFEYDTLFIINKIGVQEFIRCANDLKRVKNLSGSLNNLSEDISSIETNVTEMDKNMKSLTGFINTYDKETKVRLKTLNTENTELSKKMESISQDLVKARQKIKEERWKSFGSKVLWGIGGMVVGGLVITVVK